MSPRVPERPLSRGEIFENEQLRTKGSKKSHRFYTPRKIIEKRKAADKKMGL